MGALHALLVIRVFWSSDCLIVSDRPPPHTHTCALFARMPCFPCGHLLHHHLLHHQSGVSLRDQLLLTMTLAYLHSPQMYRPIPTRGRLGFSAREMMLPRLTSHR